MKKILFLLFAFAIVANLSAGNRKKAVLYGDGVHDDTEAIQSMLDSRSTQVKLPIPTKYYVISRPLVIYSNQELLLDRYTTVFLADSSNCYMLTTAENAGGKNSNQERPNLNRIDSTRSENITVKGGIWDCNNKGQLPNPIHFKHPQAPHYNGIGMFFLNVKHLTLSDLTVKNPTTFAITIDKAEYFTVSNIYFDFNYGNPWATNMDGVHLNGNCHYGEISNIQGACYDDMIALNTEEGSGGPISHVTIIGLYAHDCHSAVRLMACSFPLTDVVIENIHGTFYQYCVGLTKYYEGKGGYLSGISLRNIFASKAPRLSVYHKDGSFVYPFIWIEEGVNVKSLSIADVHRVENVIATPTLRIEKSATVNRLSFQNVYQENHTGTAFPVISNSGTIGHYDFQNIESNGDKILVNDGVMMFDENDASSQLRKITELTQRGGLPNFFAKAKAGKKIRVCYFGGSITAQNGWRVQSMDYLRRHFPKASFIEQNATLGGTDSQLGVLRMEQDVLTQKPDLVFVEFEVNDSGNDSEVILRSLEGIVRKIWSRYPDCDICFVYTTTAPLIAATPKGYLYRSASVSERIADFYHIPSVYLPWDVLKLLNEDKLLMKTPEGKMTAVAGDELNVSKNDMKEADGKIYFSLDGVHPYLNTGHVLYTKTMVNCLEKMENNNLKPANHNLDTPMNSDNFESSSSIDIAKQNKSGEWNLVELNDEHLKRFGDHFSHIWKAEPGASVSFSFRGESLISYDIIGPEGCALDVTVDGKTHRVNRFDSYCVYWRIHSFVLASGLDKNVEHHATIKVVPNSLDKRKILFDYNKAKFDKNPDSYKPEIWYLEQLFIL